MVDLYDILIADNKMAELNNIVRPCVFVISGHKGSGKNTLCKMFQGKEPACFTLTGMTRFPENTTRHYTFADAIKEDSDGGEEEDDYFTDGVKKMFTYGYSFIITDLRFMAEWYNLQDYAKIYGYDIEHTRIVGDYTQCEDSSLCIPFSSRARRIVFPHNIIFKKTILSWNNKFGADIITVEGGKTIISYHDHTIVADRPLPFSSINVPNETILWIGGDDTALMRCNIIRLQIKNNYLKKYEDESFSIGGSSE